MTRAPRFLVAAVAACAALALLCPQALSQGETRPGTRAHMVAVFDALSTTLNLSLYKTPFEAPENRALIMEALGVLAENADQLDTHGGELNASFDYLRRSLTRDANEAIMRYRQEQYEGARFVLDQLIESCVACHTKLPSATDFDLGREFVRRARVESLPVDQRIRLLVATRQFEAALAVYETRFRSKVERARDIAAGDALGDYLKVCLRVLNDYDRARATLTSFRKRDDVDGYLEDRVGEWIRTIDATRKIDPRGAEMASARSLIHEARQRNAFPADRRGATHFIVASGWLQRYLEQRNHDIADVAEAYYLLGVCESHTTHSHWVSETEFYLESAIRLAPATPYARLALEFLEAYLEAEYTGSAGVLIPDEVRDRLDELRRLIDRAR